MCTRRQLEIMADVESANKLAREARLLCLDIIRQTSLKPYYGKVGGAALLAPEDNSDAQVQRMTAAVRLLRRTTLLLRDAAIEGGMTEAKVRDTLEDDARPRYTIIENAQDAAAMFQVCNEDTAR